MPQRSAPFSASLALLACALAFTGCSSNESPDERAKTSAPAETSAGLPAGDANRGYAVFEKLRCTSCHQVAGYDFPGSPPALRPPLVLAEGDSGPRTPDQLRRSILDPGHELAPGWDVSRIETGGESIMPDYGHVMTVHQLADLVSFLCEAYGTKR